MKVRKTLLFMLHNPIPLIIHLTCWIFISAFLFFMLLSMTLPPEESPDDIWSLIELIGIFGLILPWIVTIAFFISYREAKGNLKGIAKERQRWMQWYTTQQQNTEGQDDAFVESLLENRQVDSYFRISEKALNLIIRNPLSIIVHFVFWFFASVLLNIIPLHLSVLEIDSVYIARNLMGPLPQLVIISIILALMSSYQEARGTVKGAAKEGEAWTKWYQRQTGAKEHGYSLAEVPPLLNID